MRWAEAFIAGFSSSETRRSYQRDWHCWLGFCTTHDLHPYKDVRRTHVELYLRELEAQLPRPSNATLYRRISTLSSWFAWLEDEEVVMCNPAAGVRRPSRHPRPQPWFEPQRTHRSVSRRRRRGRLPLTRWSACLRFNGLRVSEVCGADITDLGGWRYQLTLQVLGKGDKPALIVLNPRTYQAIDQAISGRVHGPLLLNQAQRRMQRHNAAAILRRLLPRLVSLAGSPRTPCDAPTSPLAYYKACRCGRCNAPPATPRPTPPWVMTNPNDRFTRT